MCASCCVGMVVVCVCSLMLLVFVVDAGCGRVGVLMVLFVVAVGNTVGNAVSARCCCC